MAFLLMFVLRAGLSVELCVDGHCKLALAKCCDVSHWPLCSMGTKNINKIIFCLNTALLKEIVHTCT